MGGDYAKDQKRSLGAEGGLWGVTKKTLRIMIKEGGVQSFFIKLKEFKKDCVICVYSVF